MEFCLGFLLEIEDFIASLKQYIELIHDFGNFVEW
jgi:hypothetical protein